MPSVIVNSPNGPIASDTTPVYFGTIVDGNGVGIPAANLSSLTLTIVDTMTGEVINGVESVDILNSGRGSIDDQGNLSVRFERGDTGMDEVPGSPQVQRSLVFDIVTVGGLEGRHQVNFILLRLAGE